jgi:predicted metal-dependent hydrolase
MPPFINRKMAEKFVEEHKEWIREQFKKITSSPSLPSHYSAQELHRAKVIARQVALQKLLYFNEHYHFYYASVSIRAQRTRWGSCSRRRHLSFNLQIAFLKEELVDYIIVHELCHLEQMNHSKKFWELIAQTIPDYLRHRQELKKFHLG